MGVIYHYRSGITKTFLQKNLKLIILAIAGVFIFSQLAILIQPADAVVNAVTPSTNDANRTNGWAHVNQLSQSVGETELEFVSTRGFASCFEYRTDGDTSQQTSPTNFNLGVTDGLYPFYCVNNSTRTETILADEYVEVRMVFGAESDERFDWTRFDVLYPRSAEITSPTAGQNVSGLADFNAYLNDDDVDAIQWAVRQGTCAAGTNTVFGNVDGHSDVAVIDTTDLSNQTFAFTADMSAMTSGMYCFIYNPIEDSGENDIRETSEFYLDNTAPSVPVIIFPANEQSFTTTPILNDWTESSDVSGIDYYQIAYNYDDGHSFGGSTCPALTMSGYSGFIGCRDLSGSSRNHTPSSSEQGGVTIWVRAFDNVGNVSDWSESVHYYYDNEPPVASITSPLDTDTLSGSVDILGSITDNTELSHYNLSLYPSTTDLSDGDTHSGDRLNDANWCTVPTGGTVSTSVNVIGALCTAWDTTQYPNGDYQIRLAARDASGLRDLSDPFNGGTSSIHVIDITIDNPIDDEGFELGAIDDRSNQNQDEVLGITDTQDTTDEGEVLADSGQPAIFMPLIGILLITSALTLVAVRVKS